MRKYSSGMRWCVWRWTEVPTKHLTRLHLVQTPFGAVCIHWHHGPDPEPFRHDHPVSFLSLILRGWYIEVRKINGAAVRRYERRWFNWIAASPDDSHTIVFVAPNTVTLCFMGRKRREWGFHRAKWIGWRDYYDLKAAA